MSRFCQVQNSRFKKDLLLPPADLQKIHINTPRKFSIICWWVKNSQKILMIRKEWNSYDSILQVVAILDEKLDIFIFIFFNFNFSFFSKALSTLIFLSAVSFQ